MKRKIMMILGCYIGCSIFFVPRGEAQVSEAEKLYEQGIYQLEAVGNFEDAIDIFNRVVNEYPLEKQVAARSLLKLGLCYERMGSQKAEEAYTRIIENFPDQPQLVAEARERLAWLRQQGNDAGQTIRLTYDDAIKESNALSRDGSKMAIIEFSEGQNVAYYDFIKKERILVTHYNWYDRWTYFPIWSPDGKEIAYIKSGWANTDPFSLCVSTLDGKERTIYADTSSGFKLFPKEWLPNGEGVVTEIQDSTGTTLGIAAADGSSFQPLRKFGQAKYISATVSPDSRFIAYTEGEMGNRDIMVMDMASKDTWVLTDSPADDNFPRWSPDGEHIIFKSDRHGDYAIWGVKVKDGVPQDPPFMIMTGAKDIRLLNWTPMGLALNTVIKTADIYRMPFDPVTARPTGSPELIRYTPTGSNYQAAWAPDGKQFAFIGYDEERKSNVIVVASRDCSESHKFYLPPQWGTGAMRWTPDSKAIGFSGVDSTQKYNLFRLTLETGKWEKWPLDLGYWTLIEWGKDGKTYYFTDNGLQGSDEKIVRCSLDNVDREFIYPAVMNGKGAFRSLKSSRDYNSMAIQYGPTVSVMDMQSGETKVVTPLSDTSDLPVPPVSWQSPSWSPDGTKMLLTKLLVDEKMNQVFELYILDLETEALNKIDLGNTLPKDAQIRSADWSPDGKEILLSAMSWVAEDQLMRTVIPKDR